MNKETGHNTPNNRILKAEEVWTMLGIGKNTLYQWCDQRLIPHKRVGSNVDEETGERKRGRILFSEKRILEWVESDDNDNIRGS